MRTLASMDTRYAWRTIASGPSSPQRPLSPWRFAIGGNTAMFTVIGAVLLRPVRYREPQPGSSYGGRP